MGIQLIYGVTITRVSGCALNVMQKSLGLWRSGAGICCLRLEAEGQAALLRFAATGSYLAISAILILFQFVRTRGEHAA